MTIRRRRPAAANRWAWASSRGRPAWLTILMLANPLRLHPVDRWVHGLLGHRPD